MTESYHALQLSLFPSSTEHAIPKERLARNKVYYEAHKEAVLAQVRTYRAAHKEEIKARRKAEYEANKEKHQARAKIYRAANREKILARNRARTITHGDRWAKGEHGLSRQQKRLIAEQQNWRCAICVRHIENIGSFHADHNHSTKANRALLCGHCNALLGYARENKMILREAIRYLSRYNGHDELDVFVEDFVV